ncbi:MAG TPA: hypothetical protein P5555_20135 [Candidatus Paceibacterota bacterium]|nr:hypothetical protein [Verrucomicrobiota bacterium]HRZ47493.1 hypothetical protein [Candidatus Paceibacterota bacterium]HSA01904.1 hypothetical protein [Candidatus Paceibacterota bacterium]
MDSETGSRRERFMVLTGQVASGRIMPEEFDEWGVILLQEIIAIERILRVPARDEGSSAGLVYEKVIANLGLILGAENPWGYFWKLVFNSVRDQRRRVWREQKRLVSLDGADSDDDRSLLESLIGADPAPDAAENLCRLEFGQAMADWLADYPNQEHAGYFDLWYCKEFRIKEIAEIFEVTENQVQLAIGRILKHLLRSLAKDRQEDLRQYPERVHAAWLDRWIANESLSRIAQAGGVSRETAAAALMQVSRFLLRNRE